MGGEKGRAVLGPVLGPGSPPRGRGKVTRLYALADLEGITPAWAGKSCVLGLCFELFKDHPRVGGEKAGRAPRVQQQPGSPPRGRGKVQGKPQDGFKGMDHPRVGGEKFTETLPMPTSEGSPPRGRGKGGRPGHAIIPQRITPAWAGKSQHQALRSGPGQDHPRVGGEKFNCNPEGPSHWGSPPRGRGKVGPVIVFGQQAGITPAWAGKRQ